MKKYITLFLLLSGFVARVNAYMEGPNDTDIQVGRYYNGGVIYWIDPSQESPHGLIADINDQKRGSSYAWATINSLVGARENGAYAGKTNTETIYSRLVDAAPAAAACSVSTAQGYHDWYLPSAMELAMMYANQMSITQTSIAKGGSAFASINKGGNAAFYWSSTEFDASLAWDFYFYGGYQGNYPKGGTFSVRCVRMF